MPIRTPARAIVKQARKLIDGLTATVGGFGLCGDFVYATAADSDDRAQPFRHDGAQASQLSPMPGGPQIARLGSLYGSELYVREKQTVSERLGLVVSGPATFWGAGGNRCCRPRKDFFSNGGGTA